MLNAQREVLSAARRLSSVLQGAAVHQAGFPLRVARCKIAGSERGPLELVQLYLISTRRAAHASIDLPVDNSAACG